MRITMLSFRKERIWMDSSSAYASTPTADTRCACDANISYLCRQTWTWSFLFGIWALIDHPTRWNPRDFMSPQYGYLLTRDHP